MKCSKKHKSFITFIMKEKVGQYEVQFYKWKWKYSRELLLFRNVRYEKKKKKKSWNVRGNLTKKIN